MPVKIWSRDTAGRYDSQVVTEWDRPLGGEEYRPDAEALDRQLDVVLDDALVRLILAKTIVANTRFKRIWCVGRAVRDSGIIASPALRTERRVLLWRAMAWKCWLGTRHDHPNSPLEKRWARLRPGKQAEPKNPFRVHDLFETGYWLQHQELDDAVVTFGGSVSNAVAIGRRTSINAPSVRSALSTWMRSLPPDTREQVHKPKFFGEIAKALRKRWPDKGFGSAQRPEHLPENNLHAELASVLDPLIGQIGHVQKDVAA